LASSAGVERVFSTRMDWFNVNHNQLGTCEALQRLFLYKLLYQWNQARSLGLETVLECLGLVKIWEGLGIGLVSKKNRRSRSRASRLQAHFPQQKFTEIGVGNRLGVGLQRTACHSHRLCFHASTLWNHVL